MSAHQLETFLKDLEAAQELSDRGQPEQAEAILKRAAQRFPRGWAVLAQEYMEAEDYPTAAKLFGQVLDLSKDPDVQASVLSNLGLIASKDGDRATSKECFDRAMKIDSNSAVILNNMGLSLFWEGDTPGAMNLYHKALAADPHFALAEFHLAMCHIQIGDWILGWELYESRFRKLPCKLRRLAFPRPQWTGQPVDHLLVVGEQGNGDTFMTMRLASLLRGQVKRQTWVVQKGAACVLNCLPGVKAVESLEDVGEHDAHIEAMSLFHLLKITTDNLPPAPYLTVNNPVEYGPGRHVGIVWKGSKLHDHNNYRSSDLTEWQPLLSLDGVTIHSLQVGGEDEALAFPAIQTHDKPKDWLETARRIAGMDAVVSVDTGPAHLAGALGVPLFLLLSPSAEWRWGEHPTQTALYESATLCRAGTEGRFSDSIEQAAQHIKDL